MSDIEITDHITTLRTLVEVCSYAECCAHKLLGVSLGEALAKLDRGELDGTRADIELRAWRSAIEGCAATLAERPTPSKSGP